MTARKTREVKRNERCQNTRKSGEFSVTAAVMIGGLSLFPACDKGNEAQDTEPQEARTTVAVTYCGDGKIDKARGEECDFSSPSRNGGCKEGENCTRACRCVKRPTAE